MRMKRFLLLPVGLLISISFSTKSAFSQNEIPYKLDTTFKDTVYKVEIKGNYYQNINLWLVRTEEMLAKRAFYDFEYAIRNYYYAIYRNTHIDSMERYTNRLFNHLDD